MFSRFRPNIHPFVEAETSEDAWAWVRGTMPEFLIESAAFGSPKNEIILKLAIAGQKGVINPQTLIEDNLLPLLLLLAEEITTMQGGTISLAEEIDEEFGPDIIQQVEAIGFGLDTNWLRTSLHEFSQALTLERTVSQES